MNREQTERQIAFLLSQSVWPDAPGDTVLKGIIITNRPIEEFYARRAMPFATVRASNTEPGADDPSHAAVSNFDIVMVAQNQSDPYSQGAVIGQNRVSLGSSPGRGVDEVLEQLQKVFLINTLTPLTDAVGAIQCHIIKIGPAEEVVADTPGAVKRTLTVTVGNVNTSRFYHGVTRFKATAGSQQASFTWTAPPLRFDTVGPVLVRKPGSTPPANPSDGTAITLGVGVTSYTDNVGSSGQFSWTLFEAYDEWSTTPVNIQRWSNVNTSGQYQNTVTLSI